MVRSRVVVIVMVLLLAAAHASAQEREFRILAGASPAGYVDGTGGEARFNVPNGIAVDASGTLYVADSQNCRVRKVTAAGVVTTFAGAFSSDGDNPCGNGDGPIATAQVSGPSSVAVDSAGTVYVADTFNNTIRKISGGVVSTLAGLAGVSGANDGTGSNALFNQPSGIAVDSLGTVYVADTNNHTIRAITPGGTVTTIAGLAATFGSADGTGSAARFNRPQGVAVDSAGNLYVADGNNHTIRKISAGAVVTTLAGLAGSAGSTNGTGSAARFAGPAGLAVDAAGTVYVADTNNHRIRQVTALGVVTTLAGGGFPGGFDGTGTSARFNTPQDIAIDSAGVLYVADTFSDTIRKIAPGGVVTTLAGFYGSVGAVDGAGSNARFSFPAAVAADASGNIYVADRTNQTIRKVTRSGTVTTLAGLATMIGNTDGTGSAARFSAPQGVAVDAAGTLYVADTNNHTIRTITPEGVVSTLAGSPGSSGSLDGVGSAARFTGPRGVAVDSTGVVYVADTNNHTIRKITAGGVVTTLAGLAGSQGNTDGTGNAARFNAPSGLVVDGAGNLYVADGNNHTIRKITPAGAATTLAGAPGAFGRVDGVGSEARFAAPAGIALDSATGTLYVTDSGSSTIRQVTAGGVVTTIGGCPFCVGSANWGRFNGPRGIAIDAGGDLYVADSINNTIRTTAPLPSSVVADFGAPYGLWIRREATWTQLHPFTAKALMTVRSPTRDALLVDFGPGVGLWILEREEDGDEWFQLGANSPSSMVGVDFDGDGEIETGVFGFAGQGVWVFDGEHGQWFHVHGSDVSQLAAADLDGDGGQEVIADFPGFGLWVLRQNGTWSSQLHPFDVSAMVTADLDGNGRDDLVMHFPGYGIWAYLNGATWVQVHGSAPTRLAAGDLDGNGASDLVVDFGAVYGVWVLSNGTSWAPLHPLTTDSISIGDLDGNGHDDVIIDFGAAGIWSRDDVGGWMPLHGFNPKTIAVGKF
jgi:sugar lactone lactonase YvrE